MRPGVAEVGVEGAGAAEPGARLLELAVDVEESRDGADHVRVVLARLDRVHRLYARMCVCMYVCMYVYIYIYIYR